MKCCILWNFILSKYSKTCVKQPRSNAGQKYCRMLQGEHSAILLTFIKLPFVIKIFVLSIFEWQFYTGFTVPIFCIQGVNYFRFVDLKKAASLLIILLFCRRRKLKKYVKTKLYSRQKMVRERFPPNKVDEITD